MSSAAFSRDPEHVYAILSASAAASSTLSIVNPTASFSEKRNAPLLADASKYRVAVSRVVLSGSRGLPIFIPSIKTGQPNPFLTNYSVTLTYQQSQENPPSYPAPGFSSRLAVSTYANGVLVTDSAIAFCSLTGGNISTWAANIQQAIQTQGVTVGDVIMQNITVTASAAADGRLVFKSPDPSTSFTIETGPGSNTFGTPRAFGFPDLPPPPTGPVARLSSVANTPLTMPLPAFYNGSSVIGTWTGTAPLVWIPQTSGIAAPEAPLTGQDNSKAYWTYDYAQFALVLNTALKQAYLNAATAASGASPPAGLLSSPPYVTYSRSEKAFVLWADAASTPSLTYPQGSLATLGAATAELQTIVFNEMLQNLLMLPASYAVDGTATITTGLSFVEPSPATSSSSSTEWIGIHAEASPVASLWSPIASITVSTQLIPSDSTLLSNPTVYGVGGIDNSSITTSSDSQKMLTDFVPVASDAKDINTQSSVYAPVILRWIDMPCGKGFQLDQTDFQLGWRDRVTNIINPIELTPLAAAELLLLFRRADILD